MMSHYKLEGAHLNQAKWSAALTALCFAMLASSFVANVAHADGISMAQAATSHTQGMASAYTKGGGSASAASVVGNKFAHAAAQANGRGGSALAHASTLAKHLLVAPPVSPLVRPPPPPAVVAPAPVQNPITAQLELRKKLAAQRARQAELEAIMNELLEIEGRETNSMDECSHWYDLSLKLHKLTGNSEPVRETELKKKDDCDTLYKFVEETRQKFKAFADLAHGNQVDYIIYVTSIVHDYLELKYAISLNEQLAKEFDYLVQSDEHVQKQVEELENLLNYMKEALKPEPEPEPEAAAEETVAVAAAEAPEDQDKVAAAHDELRQLDNIIKNYIDNEESLSFKDLEHLAELGGMLDRALAEGLVSTSSGKFHYLHGTLNGVLAIIVRKMVESGMEAKAAAEAEEAAKAAAEAEEAAKKAAEEEEAAKKAAEEEAAKKAAEEEAAKKKADHDALMEKMKARFAKPAPAHSVAAAQANESQAAAVAAGNNAAAVAATQRSLAQAQTQGNLASAYSHARDGGSASAFASM